MNIIDKLNTLGYKAEEEFSNLNYGGCCVFASLVADRLAELGIEAGGVVAMDFGGRAPNIDKARSNVHDESDGDEWEENGVKLSHVGIKFQLGGKTLLFDSDGVQEMRERNSLAGYDVINGVFTRDELRALADNSWNWNYSFDRGQIPKLAELVEHELTP